MGTGGSFAGGGSSGLGGPGGGSYHFSNGHPSATTISHDDAIKQVRERLARLSRRSEPYYERQFFGPLIEGVFRDLFLLYECLKSADPVSAIADRFGVNPVGPFTMTFGNALLARHGVAEVDDRIRSTARVVLDAFWLRVLNNDYAVFGAGDYKQFVQLADRNVFKSLSGHFFGVLLWQVVSQGLSGLSEKTENRLKQATQELADSLITKFENNHLGEHIDYQDLIAFIRDHEQWFRRAFS